MSRSNTPPYKKLLEALPGALVSRPPAGSGVGAPQINDGTAHVRSLPTEAPAAEAYASGDGFTATEQWVVYAEQPYLANTLVTVFTSSQTSSLTAARLAELKAQEAATGKKFLYTKYEATYAKMPEPDNIAALPPANPPGFTTFVYDVRCNVNGVPSNTVAGQMFRERVVGTNQKVTYTDHWVFYDTYFSPAGSDTVTFAPNTAADRPTTLKQFLTAQRARFDAATFDARQKWRYSQVPYAFGPLPNQV